MGVGGGFFVKVLGIDRFTIDMLVTMLSRIGLKVEVKLKAVNGTDYH